MPATTDMPATPGAPVDDFALMSAIAQGDARAFRQFYDRHSSAVYTLAIRMLKSPQDAEQLLTDLFFEIWNARERYDADRSHPLTYLMRMTRSRAIDRLRRRGPVTGVSLDPGSGIDVAVDAAAPAAAVADEDRRRVGAALAALEQDQRHIIECAYYDGLSHAQIAQKLNKPLGTVKSSIRIGLAKLKDLLRTY